MWHGVAAFRFCLFAIQTLGVVIVAALRFCISWLRPSAFAIVWFIAPFRFCVGLLRPSAFVLIYCRFPLLRSFVCLPPSVVASVGCEDRSLLCQRIRNSGVLTAMALTPLTFGGVPCSEIRDSALEAPWVHKGENRWWCSVCWCGCDEAHVIGKKHMKDLANYRSLPH